MTYLSQSQLELYAAAAGAANPQVAAAVGMAESGGNTTAHNIIPPDDSYGVWQINMLGSMGPERRQQFGIATNSQLYDVGTNAKAMVALSHGGSDFSAWSTFTSGAYRKYLKTSGTTATGQQANSIIPDLPGPLKNFQDAIPLWGLTDLLSGGPTGVAGNAFSALGDIGRGAKWLGKASNWVRVGYVVAGAAIVVVGLGMVVKDQEMTAVAGQLGKAVKKAAGAPAAKKAAARQAAAKATPKAPAKKAPAGGTPA